MHIITSVLQGYCGKSISYRAVVTKHGYVAQCCTPKHEAAYMQLSWQGKVTFGSLQRYSFGRKNLMFTPSPLKAFLPLACTLVAGEKQNQLPSYVRHVLRHRTE